MAEKGINEVRINHLEIAATTWAISKAREITGTVVDTTLNRCGASVSNLEEIKAAEAHIQRFLAAWLKNSTIEFMQTYCSDVEERMLLMQRKLEANCVMNVEQTIILPKP